MDSGSPSPEAFAYYDQSSSSWRTSPRSGIADSAVYSATWPRSGTTRAGQVFELQRSERRTDASASSCSPSGKTQCSSLKLLPTPTASDSHGGQSADKRRAAGHQLGLNDVVVTYFPAVNTAPADSWRMYRSALRRWATKIGRLAPQPVECGTRGQPRLSSPFVEWLMGLPAGYVTGLGLPRSAELRALGNGVVPRQAEYALRELVVAVLQLHNN